MSNDIQLIIERLRESIEKSGLSYIELEKRTGIAKSSIQRYASGKTKKIPVDAIQAIAKAVGVSDRYIMGWDDNEQAEEHIESQLTDDIELQEYLEELKNRSEMRMLFSLAKNATKEDVLQAVKIIEALKKDD